MNWIILAILAPILWAFNNIIDKIFLGKYFKNPTSYLILILFSGFVSLPIIYFFFNPISITNFSLLVIFMGIVQGFSYLFYNKALKIEEASRVTTIFTMNPIFTLPLAFIFLGEELKILNYIGILLMIVAAILVGYKKTKNKRFFSSKAIFLTLLATLIISINQVISKNILNSMNDWTFIFWLTTGFLIAGLLLFIPRNNRRRFITEIKANNIKIIIPLRLIGLLIYLAAAAAFYKSVSLGNISIISGLGSVQPFFVLLYAIVLTKLKPEFLREEIDKRTLVFKFLSVVLIIIGTYLTIL